jgi:pimeloyl-ACP methyl ester carboxylesterase
MPKVQVNGIEMYYETKGAGQPLLLIAGFACDHTIWSQVVAILASEYRVVVFDNRGVGQTAAPDTPCSIRQMAEDAAGLLDAIGLSPVHVAGHSMGGLIAQELALAHPEQIQTLMLLSSCARVDERGKAIIESWGELPRLVDPTTGARLSLPWVYTNALFATPGAIEEIIAQIVANPFPPSAQGIYGQSRAISRCDTSGRLGAIDCPTLVLVGSEDILLPVPFAEQLARGIRGAELVVLGKTGHGLLIESPDAVATTLLDFLRRNGAGSRTMGRLGRTNGCS